MPYVIKRVGDGYKVCKAAEPARCFSKKPLAKSTAEKQRVAILISERARGTRGGSASTLSDDKGPFTHARLPRE